MLIGVLLIGVIDQVGMYSGYSGRKYLLGWFITLYPSLIGFIYWRVYKDENYKLTFEEI